MFMLALQMNIRMGSLALVLLACGHVFLFYPAKIHILSGCSIITGSSFINTSNINKP